MLITSRKYLTSRLMLVQTIGHPHSVPTSLIYMKLTITDTLSQEKAVLYSLIWIFSIFLKVIILGLLGHLHFTVWSFLYIHMKYLEHYQRITDYENRGMHTWSQTWFLGSCCFSKKPWRGGGAMHRKEDEGARSPRSICWYGLVRAESGRRESPASFKGDELTLRRWQ